MHKYYAKEVFKDGPKIRVYQRTPKDMTWPRLAHMHDYMQIWYVKQGSCDHIVENGEYHMTPGSLLAIPPDVGHDVQNPSSDCVIYGCEFPIDMVLSDEAHMTSNIEDIFKFAYIESFESVIRNIRPCYIPKRSCQNSIEYYMTNMLKSAKSKEPFYELELKADLLKLLIEIARDYESNTNKAAFEESYKADIENAIRYINENYSKKIYINDLANQAMMCVSYFSYFFKKITNKTFIEYLNEIRIKRAIELLEDTDMTIKAISEEIGYNNSSYFNRVFKKITGISPINYRYKKNISAKD